LEEAQSIDVYSYQIGTDMPVFMGICAKIHFGEIFQVPIVIAYLMMFNHPPHWKKPHPPKYMHVKLGLTPYSQENPFLAKYSSIRMCILMRHVPLYKGV
jgi:hypothetical protein